MLELVSGAFWKLHVAAQNSKANRVNCQELDKYGLDILRIMDAEGVVLMPFGRIYLNFDGFPFSSSSHFTFLCSNMWDKMSVWLSASQKLPVHLTRSSSLSTAWLTPSFPPAVNIVRLKWLSRCRQAVVLLGQPGTGPAAGAGAAGN